MVLCNVAAVITFTTQHARATEITVQPNSQSIIINFIQYIANVLEIL